MNCLFIPSINFKDKYPFPISFLAINNGHWEVYCDYRYYTIRSQGYLKLSTLEGIFNFENDWKPSKIKY